MHLQKYFVQYSKWKISRLEVVWMVVHVLYKLSSGRWPTCPDTTQWHRLARLTIGQSGITQNCFISRTYSICNKEKHTLTFNMMGFLSLFLINSELFSSYCVSSLHSVLLMILNSRYLQWSQFSASRLSPLGLGCTEDLGNKTLRPGGWGHQ